MRKVPAKGCRSKSISASEPQDDTAEPFMAPYIMLDAETEDVQLPMSRPCDNRLIPTKVDHHHSFSTLIPQSKSEFLTSNWRPTVNLQIRFASMGMDHDLGFCQGWTHGSCQIPPLLSSDNPKNYWPRVEPPVWGLTFMGPRDIDILEATLLSRGDPCLLWFIRGLLSFSIWTMYTSLPFLICLR